MNGFRQDLRSALRPLAAAPATTPAVLLTLAPGIGATSAIPARRGTAVDPMIALRSD